MKKSIVTIALVAFCLTAFAVDKTKEVKTAPKTKTEAKACCSDKSKAECKKTDDKKACCKAESSDKCTKK